MVLCTWRRAGRWPPRRWSTCAAIASASPARSRGGQRRRPQPTWSSSPSRASTSPASSPRVAGEVARQHGNITDLSQTILAGVFVMVLVVDMRGTAGYDALVEGLASRWAEIGMEISVRLYSVYEAMHRI